MTWKDNALGIVIDRTMDADFAALKKEGFSFVVIDAATGWDASQVWAEQFTKATAAGLPILVQYTPISALDDYTFEAPAREQLEFLKKLLGAKAISGLVISMERYWVGWDIETAHNPIRLATGAAISHTAKTILETMTHQYQTLSRPVLIRSNDGFVQKYSPDIAQWSDKFGFFLADWRYRTRDAQGAYTAYTFAPKVTYSTLESLRAALPPDGSKNPLVPGLAPQLKFWECNGSVTMPTTHIKGWDAKVKTCKVVLFNGSDEAMRTYLGIGAVTPPPPVDPPSDPVNPPPGPVTPSVDLSKVIEVLEKVASNTASIKDDVTAIKIDIHTIRAIFRE